MKIERALLHPVTLCSIFLLVLNDHMLKELFPGFITGKLSDVAGMIFFPIVLAAFIQMLFPKVRSFEGRIVWCSALATAIVFVGVKTVHWANELYAHVFGFTYSLVVNVETLLTDLSFGPIRKASLIMDPSDVWAVVFVFFPILLMSSQGNLSEGPV